MVVPSIRNIVEIMSEKNPTSSGNGNKKRHPPTGSPRIGKEEPDRKRIKNASKQTSLSSFFKPSFSTKAKTSMTGKGAEKDDKTKPTDHQHKSEVKQSEQKTKTNRQSEGSLASKTDSGKSLNKKNTEQKKSTSSSTADSIPDPIIPKRVDVPRNVVWKSLYDNFVMIRKTMKDEPRSKVAAFDLDGTLVVWSTSFGGFWPSQLAHFELWSSTVPQKLRDLYDNEGYKLVFISNQGGIQKAHTGKKATLVKTVMDWLADLIDRPIHAVLSTKSLKKSPDQSFHKPTPKMWNVAVEFLNKNMDFDIEKSFFVGDSADVDDEQGGVDLRFAQNVSSEAARKRGSSSNLKFYTPTEYFGPSDSERRQTSHSVQNQAMEETPQAALHARAELLGGYIKGPILLILCGVQGSGKSTFCQSLLDQESDGINSEEDGKKKSEHWIHLSQDTISNGKPGKREKVEQCARDALKNGHSVVVDRMHLDPEQRSYFVDVAKAVNVPVHVVFLNPPKNIIASRVRSRTNHPGKVQGEEGAKRAIQSLQRIVLPTYAENVDLISCSGTSTGASRLCDLYKAVATTRKQEGIKSKITNVALDDNITMPNIALGTMGIGKRIAKDVIKSCYALGFRAIDTAPTYKNEDRVGDALKELSQEKDNFNFFCVVKIPKKVSQPEDVLPELEQSLAKLHRRTADLLLLHWPCDVIDTGNLASVWKEMEKCYNDGKCKALGVCNFNAAALAMLLPNCSIRPVVNQVERHPLLSQMELLDFCARNDIMLQAHTPLGHGKPELLSHTVLKRISEEASMSPAQVLVQWNVQQGVPVVPKCSDRGHAKEIVSRRTLSPEHMKELNGLGNTATGRFVAPPFMYGKAIYCWGGKR